MAFQGLHNAAKLRKPKYDEDLKDGVYWVAILYPEAAGQPVSNDSNSAHYLWLKCRSHLPVSTLLKVYQNRFKETINLFCHGLIARPESKLEEYNIYNDSLVVFQAFPMDTNAVVSTTPAQSGTESPATPLTANTDNSSVAQSHVSNGLQHVTQQPSLLTSGYTRPPRTSQAQYIATQYGHPGIPWSRTPGGVQHTYTNTSVDPYTGQNHVTYQRPGALPTERDPYNYTNIAEAHRTGRVVAEPSGIIPVPHASQIKPDPGFTALALAEIESPATKASPPLDIQSAKIKDEEPLEYSWRKAVREETPEESQGDDEVQNDIDLPSYEYLQQLVKDSTPERLERGVRIAGRLLARLETAVDLKDEVNQDAQHWLQAIQNLQQEQKQKTRTVVGVVGNTGAGKSSVINAMLDEERLVPTNCMRACTAVVTELSYNYEDEERLKYRAEIHFIEPKDWKKELDILASDLIDQYGEVTSDIRNADSDAGIAYAKIKAVYPKLTKEDIAVAMRDTTRLMEHKEVKKVLGTTIRLNDSNCDPFYKKLQGYVDSKEKEKSTGKDDKGKQMEFWPLIKVVKIYVKSRALETGACIVDLPGVHDSNAARSAVAQGYMKQCTGLWIVAPINRAVDDKAAKTLLGDTFKRQLKYDGTYSAVTFICSKTDDISITEAIDSLGLEDEVSGLQDELDASDSQIKSIQTTIEDVAESKHTYQANIEQHDESIEKWEDLKDRLLDGETVYAPSSSKKRKSTASRSSPKKKRRTRDDSYSGDDSKSDRSGDSEIEEIDEDSGFRQALNEDDIDDVINKLKREKKTFRVERADLEDRLKELRSNIRAIKARQKETQSKINALCIAGRNQYSKGAIQQDFAAGIRELDQENAAEEDEENFNPDEDLRDYTSVAESLPVFCVSSRAYQKLSGRLKKDPNIPGFSTLEQTEMPQLQAHCRKLTESGRASACRLFINKVAQLLNSLALWASNDGTGPALTDKQQAAEYGFLKTSLNKLETGLDKAITNGSRAMRNTLAEHIYEKYDDAINQAETNALPVAQGWGAHRNAGGLYWSTYKATVKRDGVYSGASGPKDFNQELVEPMVKMLATGWERSFTSRLPHVLKDYAKSTKSLLRDFHKCVEARARDKGIGIAGISMLSSQVVTYEQSFSNIVTECSTIMIELQKEANREFTPTIVEAMLDAYRVCTEERGTGSYARMKFAMSNHVERQRSRMFNLVAEKVKSRLDDMCRAVKKRCDELSFEIFRAVERDYKQIFGGVQLPEGGILMSKSERTIKKNCKAIIWKADEYFRPVVLNEPLTSVEVDEALAEQKQKDDVAVADEDKAKQASTEEDSNDELAAADTSNDKTIDKEDSTEDTMEDIQHPVKQPDISTFGTPLSTNGRISISSQLTTSPSKARGNSMSLSSGFSTMEKENMDA